MNKKIIKLFLAVISLLIGFAIVHSVSPEKKTVSHNANDDTGPFDFNSNVEDKIPCVYGMKPYDIHFTAYQQPDEQLPDIDYQQAFCKKLPGTGETLITIDIMDKVVRERPMTLTFIRHDQLNPSADTLATSVVIGEHSYNSAPRGIIQSRINFSQSGFYTLSVKIGGEVLTGSEVVKIPFEVAGGL